MKPLVASIILLLAATHYVLHIAPTSSGSCMVIGRETLRAAEIDVDGHRILVALVPTNASVRAANCSSQLSIQSLLPTYSGPENGFAALRRLFKPPRVAPLIGAGVALYRSTVSLDLRGEPTYILIQYVAYPGSKPVLRLVCRNGTVSLDLASLCSRDRCLGLPRAPRDTVVAISILTGRVWIEAFRAGSIKTMWLARCSSPSRLEISSSGNGALVIKRLGIATGNAASKAVELEKKVASTTSGKASLLGSGEKLGEKPLKRLNVGSSWSGLWLATLFTGFAAAAATLLYFRKMRRKL